MCDDDQGLFQALRAVPHGDAFSSLSYSMSSSFLC